MNLSTQKKKILIFVEYYVPGYKAGGPIRSIVNLVTNLSDSFEFFIVTRNHDLGEKSAYHEIISDVWQDMAGVKVLYLSKSTLTISNLLKILKSEAWDIVYLNSFFSLKFSILPLFFLRLLLTKIAIVIAPRGEFSKKALNLKKFKKTLYVTFVKLMKLYHHVKWHASTDYEADQIKTHFLTNSKIYVAPDLPTKFTLSPDLIRGRKSKIGQLRLLFLSRISRMKNLYGALNILNLLSFDVIFNIYGPVEDKTYWEQCKKRMEKLPNNIQVHYHGAIMHDEIPQVVALHDIFFLPTWGENYGHVIMEALMQGCPVLISDNTPWRNLRKKNVGADISLSNENEFVNELTRYAYMKNVEYQKIAENAIKYANSVLKNPDCLNANKKIFLSV